MDVFKSLFVYLGARVLRGSIPIPRRSVSAHFVKLQCNRGLNYHIRRLKNIGEHMFGFLVGDTKNNNLFDTAQVLVGLQDVVRRVPTLPPSREIQFFPEKGNVALLGLRAGHIPGVSLGLLCGASPSTRRIKGLMWDDTQVGSLPRAFATSRRPLLQQQLSVLAKQDNREPHTPKS